MSTPAGTAPAVSTDAALTAATEHQLRDGSTVTLRPLQRSDAELERRFISELSAQSRRYRFLGQIGCPSDALITQLTTVDFVHDVAFVAVIAGEQGEREVGVARYSRSPDGSRCECAVAVSDELQGQGLGTLLMQRLITVARAHGIREMISVDAAENSAMRDLALALGFSRSADPQDACQVVHRLALQ